MYKKSLILMALCFSQSALAATYCEPAFSPQVVCLNSNLPCKTLGATTMDGDKKNLIACLMADDGTQKWKAMTNSGGIGACYTAKVFGGVALASSLTSISGFTTIGPSVWDVVTPAKVYVSKAYHVMSTQPAGWYTKSPAEATCNSGYERVSCLGSWDSSGGPGVFTCTDNSDSGCNQVPLTQAYNAALSNAGCIGGTEVTIVCCKH